MRKEKYLEKFEKLKKYSVLCTPFFEHDKKHNNVKNLSDNRKKSDYRK